MPGKICPQCKKPTFFMTATGGRCTNPGCRYEMKTPARPGLQTGGRGKRCPFCNKWTLINGNCRNPNCGSRR